MATNPYDQQILDQIARMDSIANSYKPAQINIPDFNAIAHQYDNRNVVAPIDWSNYAKDIFATPAKKSTDNGWLAKLGDVLSGTLGQVGGAVTNTAYNELQNLMGIKNIVNSNDPLYKKIFGVINAVDPMTAITQTAKQDAVNGAKEQWKDWTDGKLSWGDVPLVGFLHGVDQGNKKGSDILSSLGVKNKWANTIGGIGIDILGDPLTYFTGGLSTASKLGEVAKAGKVLEIANDIGKGIEDTATLNKAAQAVYKARTGLDASMTADRSVAENIGKIASDIKAGSIKDVNELKAMAQSVYTDKYAAYPNLTQKMVDMKMGQIDDAIKTAQNTAFNNHINTMSLSIPFTNKALPIGELPKWSPTYRTEATLGADYAHLAEDAVKKVAGDNAARQTQVTNALKEHYGVNSLADLTKTQYADMVDKLQPFLKDVGHGLPDSKITETMVNKSMPNQIFDIASKTGRPVENVNYAKTTVDDILKQLDPRVAQKIAPMLQGMSDIEKLRNLAPEAVKMFGDFAKKIMKTVKGKTLEDVQKSFNDAADVLRNASHTGTITKEPDIVWKELNRTVEHFKNGNPEKLASLSDKAFYKNIANLKAGKYNEMNNAKTSFEHFLDRKNPFDARTLQSGNKFVNSMADHVADAQSEIQGNNAKYRRALTGIKNYIKKEGITDEEMKQAIYHLEGKAPEALGGRAWQASDRIKALANQIKPILDSLGKDEMASGSLKGLRDNYFPHVLQHSEQDMANWQDFIDRHPELKNLSSNNKFDNVRKTFETIADRDNYIAKVEKAIQKETDPVKIESLERQLDHVANMFDTNVVSALTRRIREGVRSSAMKSMQTNLKKFGMLKTAPKRLEDTKGLKEIDSATAKKLGLDPKEKHYIHPEVLKGMERVDQIFTNEGMNKFVRHMTAINDIWRPLVTFYKPSHYRNNLIGNGIINMAAGVKSSDYKVAGKLMNAYRKGKLTKEQQSIIDSAFKHNVISGGFLHDGDLSYKFADPTKLEKLAKKVGDNKVIQKARSAGEFFDDITRLANYVNGIRKYGSAAQAAKQVRTYLFNYNELTNADRAMRVVMPFWNWTKRNVPLQMKLLLDSPKFALNQERFKDLFNKNDDKGKDYQKEGGIKIPFTNYYSSIPFPTNDLNSVINPMTNLGSLTPAVKVPIELQTNKQLFNGSPISYGSQQTQPQDLPRYLMSQLGGKDIYNMASGNKSVLETLANLINPISKADPKK